MRSVPILDNNILFLGTTFKENCSDTRNTKVKDLINLVKNLGVSVSLWDPVVDQIDLQELHSKGIKIYKTRPQHIEFAFLCVNHDEINHFLNSHKGIVFDYKNIDFN